MSDALDDKIFVEKVGKFNIYFQPLIEDDNPLDHQDFENEEQKQEYIRLIENGTISVFIAKVTAEIVIPEHKIRTEYGDTHTTPANQLELGNSYLGMCEYNSFEDFYKNEDGTIIQNDCYADMKDEAIQEANRALKELTAQTAA